MKFKTTNEIAKYVQIKRAQKVAETGGAKILLRDVEKELAEYCGITLDGLRSLKAGRSQPSLHVAMRVADYFGVKIEDVFQLVVLEDDADIEEKTDG